MTARANRRRLAAVSALTAAVLTTGVAAAQAHVHAVANPDHTQPLADGQNHAPFVFNAATGMYESCGVVGPAGYGLETAHHGPDEGTPGSADGCFALTTAPAVTDNNPAID